MTKKIKCYCCGKETPLYGEFCPYCGTWIRSEIHTKSKIDNNSNLSKSSKKIQGLGNRVKAFLRQHKQLFECVVLAFAMISVVGILMGIALMVGDDTNDTVSTDNSSRYNNIVEKLSSNPEESNVLKSPTETSLKAEELPQNGTIYCGGILERPSQVIIKTASYNVYVKFKDHDGNDVFSFFVRKNSNITMNVPAQKLYLYYAQGTTWYGTDDCFGPSTIYNKDPSVCDFTQYSYEYSFEDTISGNFQPTQIDKGKF